MGHPTIDNVRAANAIFDGVQGTFDLRQHTTGDGAVGNQGLDPAGAEAR